MFKALPDVAPDLSTYKQSSTASAAATRERTSTLYPVRLSPHVGCSTAVWTPDSHERTWLSWHSIHAIAYELEYAAGVL